MSLPAPLLLSLSLALCPLSQPVSIFLSLLASLQPFFSLCSPVLLSLFFSLLIYFICLAISPSLLIFTHSQASSSFSLLSMCLSFFLSMFILVFCFFYICCSLYFSFVSLPIKVSLQLSTAALSLPLPPPLPPIRAAASSSPSPPSNPPNRLSRKPSSGFQ